MIRLIVVFIFVFSSFACRTSAQQVDPAKPKNVIMMVMDGTNSDVVTLARMYKGSPLALDEILVGGVMTRSLRSAITDSGAAGTALATGHKTLHNAIGMVPGANGFAPVVNLSEAARNAGLATGIVSTSEIQNATPANYSAHVTNRSNYHDISEQQVYQNLDIVLGGGKNFLNGKNRDDKENLLKVIQDHGYEFVETKRELFSARSGKVWGSFAPVGLSNHFDRTALTPEQPTLSEMTRKAIEILAQKQRGFFLFVEGSKVDWAAHKNDPVGMISEVLGFDEAVGTALDFAKKDGNTLVIAVTDHGNSGLTIGDRSTDKTYMKTPPEVFIKPLKKARLTLEGVMTRLEDGSSLRETARDYGLGDLTWQEWMSLKNAESLENELVTMLAKRAHIGFTTKGHTGEDVFLYAYGPGKPGGLLDNTEIPKVIVDYLGIGGKVKYVEAGAFFKGYQLRIKGSESANPILVAERNGEVLEYPENKNFYVKNGEKIETLAPNVFNGEQFFVAVPTEN